MRLDKLGKYLTAEFRVASVEASLNSLPWITGINHRSKHETKNIIFTGIQQGSSRSLTGKWIHSHSFGFLKTSPISNVVFLFHVFRSQSPPPVLVCKTYYFTFFMLNKKRDHESKFRSELLLRWSERIFLFHFVFCVRRCLCCWFLEPLEASGGNGVSGWLCFMFAVLQWKLLGKSLQSFRNPISEKAFSVYLLDWQHAVDSLTARHMTKCSVKVNRNEETIQVHNLVLSSRWCVAIVNLNLRAPLSTWDVVLWFYCRAKRVECSGRVPFGTTLEAQSLFKHRTVVYQASTSLTGE